MGEIRHGCESARIDLPDAGRAVATGGRGGPRSHLFEFPSYDVDSCRLATDRDLRRRAPVSVWPGWLPRTQSMGPHVVGKLESPAVIDDRPRWQAETVPGGKVGGNESYERRRDPLSRHLVRPRQTARPPPENHPQHVCASVLARVLANTAGSANLYPTRSSCTPRSGSARGCCVTARAARSASSTAADRSPAATATVVPPTPPDR